LPRSRWRLIGCALSPVMLLTACTVGPDFKSPEPPASQGYRPGEKLASSTDVPGRWWERFRSRPLNELIYDGLANNTDLHAAEAALRVAQANALAQRGALFPEITAGFNSNRQLTPTEAVTTNAASGASLYSVHTAQVSVSFVPDVFGGTRRQIESSDAQVEMQAFQREGVFLTLSANIALAAIQEASLRGQIAATQRLIDLQVQSLNLLKIQNERGQIAMPDVVAQETAVAQARLLLPGLEKQLNQQRHLLAYLTGRLPSDPLPATFQLSSFRLPRPLPRTLPADLIRQRPDVRAAESNLHAVNAQIGVAIAARLPQKQRAAEAATDQALAQYRSAVLAACQNVADVLRALEADERTLNAAIAAERSAEQSITLARAQIERGQVAISVLITAQQAFLQASLARVQAQAGRLADTVALFQALGGGWWNRIEVDPRVEAFNAALEKTQARAQAAQADAATAQ
jgi:outer membrane protein TolC